MSAFATIVKEQKPQSVRLMSEGNVGARLVTYKSGDQAIMKISATAAMKQGRKLQRGLDTRTMPQREVAFYRLSKVVGFNCVPETVLGEFHGYPASFQRYVTAAKLYDVEPRLRKVKDHEQWVIAFREAMRDKVPFSDTLRLTVLDFLAASRDRHGANYGVQLDIDSGKARWKLIGWDNGCAFGHTMAMYHCVAHKYLFRYAFDASSVWSQLQAVKREDIQHALAVLNDDVAVDHVWLRLQFLLTFPHRMPWVTLSGGKDEVEDFPSYESFFKPLVPQLPLYVLQFET